MSKMTERARELVAYFKIREDSDKIKRVEELAIKRDVAESVNNTDEVAIIDSELTTYGEVKLINKKGVKNALKTRDNTNTNNLFGR